MKAGREHRVPLATRAVIILRQLEETKAGEFVFPGQARDKPLSNMAMEMVLRRMKIQSATVHGFRSSFRDWAGNESNFPRELVETALAHVIGDKAEQAYPRVVLDVDTVNTLSFPRNSGIGILTSCSPAAVGRSGKKRSSPISTLKRTLRRVPTSELDPERT